jgi:membrane fusion protein, heavy metal efflux system
MTTDNRLNLKTCLLCFVTLVALGQLLNAPTVVLAGAGHDHSGASDFQGGGGNSGSVRVNAATAKRLGIKTEPVKRQPLAKAIKTTGQIETLPDQRVDVTAPLTSKVVELLVKPGSEVKKDQPVAVVASPELVELRVGSQEKQAEAVAALQKAEADLKLAKQNLERQQQISNAEVAQAVTQISAAQSQYQRDLALINERGVLKVAQENLKRQQQIAQAEIAQATTEVAVATEQYNRDRELVEKGALPRRQMLESQAKWERAKAELARAKNLPQVVQAESEVKKAEVDLPLRELRDSQSRLAEAQTQLKRAQSRREVFEAQAQFKRAQADVEAAQSQIKLSNTTYKTRLEQLGTIANDKGLVTITAPLSGIVAERTVSLGQSLQDAGGKLMTIVNSSEVFATANIYEKDLDKVKVGQRIRVKVASVPNKTFTGRISQIGTVVGGETRVVPVQAVVENSSEQLKPGMFAELEVITGKQSASVIVIPTSAIVDANGKKIVYAQNGNAFQAVDVELGETSGDLVEVKNGLFEGDTVVTQRAPQLYSQSLRGDNPNPGDAHPEGEQGHGEETKAKVNILQRPSWLMAGGGGAAIATAAFLGGLLWSNRQQKERVVLLGNSTFEAYEPKNFETEVYIDNQKPSTLLTSSHIKENENKD